MQSLLYVSHRLVTDDDIVCAIVAAARPRNAHEQLTGALVATPTHFAQILEGEPAAIEAMMARIARDHRHREIAVLSTEERSRRDFENWTLAYHGDSSYIAGLLAPALAEPEPDPNRHAANIRNLIAMFS